MKISGKRQLNDAQLKRLKEHKYSCSSCSLFDPLLQPWWNWLVNKTPMWLAPNLITIIGLIMNILTTFILIWYSPDAKGEPPRWSFVLCALGLFTYQSLDAIDGKQARRTGTANPLGELFDHGCDSLSTIFVAISACIAVQLGYHPEWMFFQCFCAMTLFYCAHWQAYVSGTLRFGKIDVTEAQFTIIGIHLISAFFGADAWQTVLFSGTLRPWYGIPASTIVVGLWSLFHMLKVIFTGGVGKNGSTVANLAGINGSLVVSFTAIVGFAQLLCGMIRVVMRKGGCGKNGSTVAIPGLDVESRVMPTYLGCFVMVKLAYSNFVVIFSGGAGKNGSTVAGTSVLSPIIPFSTVLVPAFIIYRKSTDSVYENSPSLYILAFGLVAAKVTNRLVVAHMTKSEMDYTDWSLLGPLMLFLNQYFNTFIPEYYVLWLCMIYVTFDLFRYCYQICTEICQHLHIELFRVPAQRHSAATLPETITEKNGTNSNRAIKSRNRKSFYKKTTSTDECVSGKSEGGV